ncbi:MAG: hypothetical protein ACK4VM_01020 [Bosea sp. (in: a-proteobacteria)]
MGVDQTGHQRAPGAGDPDGAQARRQDERRRLDPFDPTADGQQVGGRSQPVRPIENPDILKEDGLLSRRLGVSACRRHSEGRGGGSDPGEKSSARKIRIGAGGKRVEPMVAAAASAVRDEVLIFAADPECHSRRPPAWETPD